MKYLIYSSEFDAKERNHEEMLLRSPWVPETMRDTAYWWSMKFHPSSGEVALCIPESDYADPEVSSLDQTELDDLIETLPAGWEVEDV